MSAERARCRSEDQAERWANFQSIPLRMAVLLDLPMPSPSSEPLGWRGGVEREGGAEEDSGMEDCLQGVHQILEAWKNFFASGRAKGEKFR